MVRQLALGAVLISVTIVIVSIAIGFAIRTLRRFGDRLVRGHVVLKSMLTLTLTTLWLLAALGNAIGLWAASLWWLGVFDSFETALYFSGVSFTTLGFGDVTLGQDWRLLSIFIAANGLVLFSLSTAFLIEVVRRLREAGVPR